MEKVECQRTKDLITPRHYEGKTIDNPFDFDSAIRRDRETASYNDMRAMWSDARDASRNRKNRSFNMRVIVIALILVLIFSLSSILIFPYLEEK